MEDNEIIKLFHKRQEKALLETEKKYQKLLYKIANEILKQREESEEVLNDTYLKAWDTMPPTFPKSLCAYLGAITRNFSLSRYRKSHAIKRSGILVELEDITAQDSSLENSLNLEELTKIIERWLDSLKKEERILFVKRYWFSDNLGELAQAMNIKEKTLSTKLFRLRKSLKDQLIREGFVI